MVGGYEAVLSVAKAIGTGKYRIYAEGPDQFHKAEGPAILIRMTKQERKEEGALFTRQMQFSIDYAEKEMTNAKFYAFLADMENALLPSFEMAGRHAKPTEVTGEMKEKTGNFRFRLSFFDDDLPAENDKIEEMEELIYGITGT
ncbi:MAG: hypothetical protein E7332_07980 [Clostridiales bacterium]|nr:hypothetical protein [Clostridiales bacterium]